MGFLICFFYRSHTSRFRLKKSGNNLSHFFLNVAGVRSVELKLLKMAFRWRKSIFLQTNPLDREPLWQWIYPTPFRLVFLSLTRRTSLKQGVSSLRGKGRDGVLISKIFSGKSDDPMSMKTKLYYVDQ